MRRDHGKSGANLIVMKDPDHGIGVREWLSGLLKTPPEHFDPSNGK